MILAFDSYYYGDKAKTVALGFEHWTDEHPSLEKDEILDGIAEYEPGAFYKRELPCILSLLQRFDLKTVEGIVVDGFVVLDDTAKPGLGLHLYNVLERKVAIIGVAKTSFHDNRLHVREVLRGESEKPLYITAVGMELEAAAENVRTMHGEFRFPTLLKKLDSLTKADQ